MSRFRLRTAVAVVLVAAVAAPWSSASAADRLGVITNYKPAGLSSSWDIAAGSDGALWFVNLTDQISRMTTAGTITHYTGIGVDDPRAIAAGSDGALWFVNAAPSSSIGRITTAGATSKYTDPSIASPGDIAAGPDGALWFTNGGNNSIGRITTAGVVSSFDLTSDLGSGEPVAIAAGPDGAVWFTYASGPLPSGGGDVIGRITTVGVVTSYTATGIDLVRKITAGPDGALWFTNWGADDSDDSIGRITPAGAVTSYSDPSMREPHDIAAGPDGALWFTNLTGFYDSIGRITTAGAVTNYTDPELATLISITAGPDGNMWFANLSFSIGKIGTDRRFGITTTSLPEAWLGGAYTATLAAVDGVAPYRWKRIGGNLPKGLKLYPRTGVIRGLPKKRSGTFTFTVQARYKTKVKGHRAVTHTTSQVLSITVT